MATQVVSNQQQNNNRVNVDGSTDNLSNAASVTGLGPSYANAVIKLAKGTRDSDKENISDYHVGTQGQHAAAGVKDCNVINKMTCPKASAQNLDEAMAIGSSPQDEGDSFTTVTNHHNRKDRKKEERFVKRTVKIVNGVPQQGPKEDKSGDEKRHEKGNSSANRPALTEQEQDEKKVFVEAPLPKVNPWQANRNAAQAVVGQQNEKRVLQNISGACVLNLSLVTSPTNKMRIAGTTTTANNTVAQPSVVRASKDRKKYNAKVRLYYLYL